MRFLIPFLCLILLASCHHQSDLKKISELEKENKIISDSLNKQNKIIKLVYDSLVEKEANKMIICSIDFSRFMLINKQESQIVKENNEYRSKVFFARINNFTGSHYMEYSLPQKLKSNLQECNLKLYGNPDHEYYDFSFIPKDTGWYYWSGNLLLKNDRTNIVTKYPITDSFYVYK